MQGKVSKLTKQLISSLQPAIKKINASPVMDLFQAKFLSRFAGAKWWDNHSV